METIIEQALGNIQSRHARRLILQSVKHKLVLAD